MALWFDKKSRITSNFDLKIDVLLFKWLFF